MPNKKVTGKSTPSSYPTRSRIGEKNSTTVSDLAEELMENNSDSEDGIDESSISYRLVKNLITKVESSIKAELYKAVGEIREDVSGIKVQLEQYNESLTEVKERISCVEDKVEKLQDVGKNLDEFKKQWEGTLTQVNMDACRLRKNNVIIHGIKGGTSDPDIAMKNFEHFCEVGLKMPKEWIENVELVDCYHISPKGGEGNWPLFVTFSKSRYRADVFKSAHNLKGTDYFMKNDLAPWLLKIRKHLIDQSDLLKKDPHNCDTKMRDTPFKVWMIYKRPRTSKWLTWKGWNNFNTTANNET